MVCNFGVCLSDPRLLITPAVSACAVRGDSGSMVAAEDTACHHEGRFRPGHGAVAHCQQIDGGSAERRRDERLPAVHRKDKSKDTMASGKQWSCPVSPRPIEKHVLTNNQVNTWPCSLNDHRRSLTTGTGVSSDVSPNHRTSFFCLNRCVNSVSWLVSQLLLLLTILWSTFQSPSKCSSIVASLSNQRRSSTSLRLTFSFFFALLLVLPSNGVSAAPTSSTGSRSSSVVKVFDGNPGQEKNVDGAVSLSLLFR